MSHTYVTLDEFKANGAANISGTGLDARLLEDLESHSRQLEQLLKRRLHPYIQTIRFSGNGKNKMLVPRGGDLISITTLKEDNNRDGTYEVTWAATDYLLTPDENDPTDPIDPKPYWRLEVDQRTSGDQDAFLKGQQMYELVGKFGYMDLTLDSGTDVNMGAGLNATETTVTVDDGTVFDVGHTILIDSEQMYITAISTNDLTVRRGMNGTTAATHADDADISKYVYPENVVKAVIYLTSQYRSRQVSGYTDRMSLDGGNVITPVAGTDRSFWELVERYKRWDVT